MRQMYTTRYLDIILRGEKKSVDKYVLSIVRKFMTITASTTRSNPGYWPAGVRYLSERPNSHVGAV